MLVRSDLLGDAELLDLALVALDSLGLRGVFGDRAAGNLGHEKNRAGVQPCTAWFMPVDQTGLYCYLYAYPNPMQQQNKPDGIMRYAIGIYADWSDDMKPKCPLCTGNMRKGKAHSRGAANRFSGGMFIIGGALLTITIVGAIIGIPMIILGVILAGKKSNVWKCGSCGHAVARA